MQGFGSVAGTKCSRPLRDEPPESEVGGDGLEISARGEAPKVVALGFVRASSGLAQVARLSDCLQ